MNFETKTPIRNFYVSPVKASRLLFYISLLLLAGYLLSIYLVLSGKTSTSAKWWYVSFYFDFNGEANIPTLFSTILLMAAAMLNFFLYIEIGKYDRKQAWYWLLLGIIFMFLSIDENLQIHEAITDVVRPRLKSDLSGLLHWSWVIPYSVFVLFTGIYFLKFVFKLPSKTRNLFIVSGMLFIVGALGLEFIEGYCYKKYGLNHIINKVLYCIEELFEMWGVILFIYALLDYIAAFPVTVHFLREKEQ